MTIPNAAPCRPNSAGAALPGGRAPAGEGRGLPKAIKLLLPVWGYRYVRQFLELGLPTLLAPGNVPALAQSLPCEFVILTSTEDEAYIREHPAFARLAAICRAEIRLIDHLVTGSNYSTTITLAYAEAVRATGSAMLDTCFFFLVSDYIVAQGSLASVLKAIQAGASGVQVGNFQVTAEDAIPWLREELDPTSHTLALPPRDLVGWALGHLHPATVANVVNFPLSHNAHTNRLFWRVDANTLLGRFYLMHMICIRPETENFNVGSSCDYSFIPEMCPSGNVSVLTDSDDYLVIEMQPGGHEAGFLRPGPLRPADLARTLGEWTTAGHRQNASHSIVFHAADPPDVLPAAISGADAYIQEVARATRRKPQPHWGHPYWRGAIAAFREATGQRLNSEEWRLVLGVPDPGSPIFERARSAWSGRPPRVWAWYPLWPDYHLVLTALAPFLADPGQRLLTVSDVPTPFTVMLADSGERVMRFQTSPVLRNLPERYRALALIAPFFADPTQMTIADVPAPFTVALAGHGERVVRLQTTPFLRNPPERYEALRARFDLCLLEFSESDMESGPELVDRIAPLMKAGGKILIVIYNRRGMRRASGFGASIAHHGQRMLRPSARLDEVYFVPASRLRWGAYRALARLGWFARRHPLIGAPALVVFGGLLTLLTLVGNFLAAAATKAKLPRGIASSMLIVLQVEGGQKAAPGSASMAFDGRRSSRGLRPASRPMAEAAAAGGSEAAPVGATGKQAWQDDPGRLGVVLARYRFVAKMLGGRTNVAELGCRDPFGTRIVRQEIKEVMSYHFDPALTDDDDERLRAPPPSDGRDHDILKGPLPEPHDAIYSLDLLESIAPDDEHAFLANLRGSLTDDGVLIIGTASIETQALASAGQSAPSLSCKSGTELKLLLGQYFTTVFLFSMSDETIHVGSLPMAQYRFAVCCGKKQYVAARS
jgi:hypothetical protein